MRDMEDWEDEWLDELILDSRFHCFKWHCVGIAAAFLGGTLLLELEVAWSNQLAGILLLLLLPLMAQERVFQKEFMEHCRAEQARRENGG